jgi:hypothetical protein
MAERKKNDRDSLGKSRPMTEEEIDSAEWKKKIARKKDAKLRQKIERDNARLMLLGLETERKQQAEKAARVGVRYRRTAGEIASLSLKAI